MAYLARKNIRHLKHIGSIHDYVKEFSSLMIEEFLFNFMDNLQGVGRAGIKMLRCSRLSHSYGSSKVFNKL